MLGQVRDKIKRWIRGQPFEAIQIEVTSRCTLRCIMCPRTALAEEWPALDLPWEAFLRVARAFSLARHVHLQGWGEPLLHPRLFDMILEAKAAGCRVGFTTNGMLLDRAVCGRLLDLDLDLLAVSLAGATRGTHEGIRVGSDFVAILENVSRLIALRTWRRRATPKVEIFFLMTATNIAELPQAVDLAASLGADELVATNLDYLVTREHAELKAFACAAWRNRFAHLVHDAGDRARQVGLAFRAYPLDLEEAAMCGENPVKILFISCDGWVSPCTYMGLAGRADIPRVFRGDATTVPRLRFGNVLEQDLLEIWEAPPYRAFRRQFAARLAAITARALGTLSGGGAMGELPPPPEPCRTCYKLYGV